MKAWQMSTLDFPWNAMEIVDVETPEPGPGELRIDVQATDLNFADILQCQGRYQVKLEPPFTPGMNAAGVISAVGPGAPAVIGQAVVGPTVGPWGGYAEQAILRADQVEQIPLGVSCESAAAMHITYGTAWFGLHLRGQLRAGETVLVLAGAGGVGSAAIQLAKAHGCWVAAAAGSAEKLDVCRRLGADEVVDYTQEDWYDQVMALTDKRGVDVVYDPVGGDYFDVARRLVAWEGRLLVIGFASDRIPSAPTNHALVKNYSVVGVHMGGYRQQDPSPFKQCYAELFDLLLKNKIQPWIDSVVGFTELIGGMRRLANRQTKGRVIFDPRLLL